jgi:hypothetical protein
MKYDNKIFTYMHFHKTYRSVHFYRYSMYSSPLEAEVFVHTPGLGSPVLYSFCIT